MSVSFDSMRKQITLKTQNATDDGYGGQVVTDEIYAIVWARITPLQTSRTLTSFVDDRLQHVRFYEVYIRYDPAVNEMMKAEYNGKTWDIVSLEDINGEHNYLRLVCKEKIA